MTHLTAATKLLKQLATGKLTGMAWRKKAEAVVCCATVDLGRRPAGENPAASVAANSRHGKG